MTIYQNNDRIVSLVSNIRETAGTNFVKTVDGDGIEKDSNGFYPVAAYVAYDRDVPDWMDLHGLRALDPTMYLVADYMPPETDDTVVVIMPIYQDDNGNWYVAQSLPNCDCEVRYLIDEPGRGYLAGSTGVIAWFGGSDDRWLNEQAMVQYLFDIL